MWQTSVSTHIRTEKLSPSSWASTTSILHQRQAHIKETMRFSIKEGRAWGLNNVFRHSRIKGCKLNVKWNFSRVSFLSKVEFSLLPWFGYGPIYSLQNELKGWVKMFQVYGRSRIMDLMTWHGNLTQFFILGTKPNVHGL